MKLLNKVRNTVATNVMNFLREEDGVGVVEMILILFEKYFISYSL